MSKLDFYRLTDEQKSYAAQHLNEHEETRERFVEEIRQWHREKGGPSSTIDDNLILRYLRCCKFDVEATKKKIENFYVLLDTYPQYFSNLDPSLPRIRSLLQLGTFSMVRSTDGKTGPVGIIRPVIYDPNVTSIVDVFKVNYMIFECLLKDDVECSVYGVNHIIDLKGLSFSHVMQMTPKILRDISIMYNNKYPVLVKGFHFVNVPTMFYMAVKIFKSLIKGKLQKRIHVYNNTKHLLQILPCDMLPSDYGGTAESIDNLIRYASTIVLDNKDWLKETEFTRFEWVKYYRSK